MARRFYSKRHYAMVQGYPGSKGNPDYRTPAERRADEAKIFADELRRARERGDEKLAALLEQVLAKYSD